MIYVYWPNPNMHENPPLDKPLKAWLDQTIVAQENMNMEHWYFIELE